MDYIVYRVDDNQNAVIVKTFSESEANEAYAYATQMNSTATKYTYIVKKVKRR